MSDLEGLRAVLTQPENDFGKLMSRVLSPARPLQSVEFLRGRAEQLNAIKRSLLQPGRHALIHGLRGVGKSSLAQTCAYSLADSEDAVLIACDGQSTFSSIIREVFDQVNGRSPTLEKRITEKGLSFGRFGISADGRVTTEEGRSSSPNSINEAVRLIRFITESLERDLVVVVDEFDLIENRNEQILFTNFLKQVSDQHVKARFIVCGIGESVEVLMDAHGSADRYFHTVGLKQLPWEARYEIVENAASALGIEIDENTVIRIARISDGFPHYVHFISEKLFWRVFEARNGGVVTPELFEKAMNDAAEAMDMKLRKPYEDATQKYQNDYETVLWAAADGHELRRRSSDIFSSYERIATARPQERLDRAKFNQRINALKRDSHGSILTGTRAGWYEFSETMIRGYVRLRAEQNGVDLEVDHPAVAKIL
ncbi:ATP-binding protein [Cognatishimia sp. MH4019]|uniref:ATP-binding protein n=1 Tax=Cognatishimia sp. MH4019 TaxID=2854030 RepID=UPI001CD6D344|nr:ATP-binding protein [Cognatishimia sp. MH4019]